MAEETSFLQRRFTQSLSLQPVAAIGTKFLLEDPGSAIGIVMPRKPSDALYLYLAERVQIAPDKYATLWTEVQKSDETNSPYPIGTADNPVLPPYTTEDDARNWTSYVFAIEDAKWILRYIDESGHVAFKISTNRGASWTSIGKIYNFRPRSYNEILNYQADLGWCWKESCQYMLRQRDGLVSMMVPYYNNWGHMGDEYSDLSPSDGLNVIAAPETSTTILYPGDTVKTNWTFQLMSSFYIKTYGGGVFKLFSSLSYIAYPIYPYNYLGDDELYPVMDTFFTFPGYPKELVSGTFTAGSQRIKIQGVGEISGNNVFTVPFSEAFRRNIYWNGTGGNAQYPGVPEQASYRYIEATCPLKEVIMNPTQAAEIVRELASKLWSAYESRGDGVPNYAGTCAVSDEFGSAWDVLGTVETITVNTTFSHPSRDPLVDVIKNGILEDAQVVNCSFVMDTFHSFQAQGYSCRTVQTSANCTNNGQVNMDIPTTYAGGNRIIGIRSQFKTVSSVGCLYQYDPCSIGYPSNCVPLITKAQREWTIKLLFSSNNWASRVSIRDIVYSDFWWYFGNGKYIGKNRTLFSGLGRVYNISRDLLTRAVESKILFGRGHDPQVTYGGNFLQPAYDGFTRTAREFANVTERLLIAQGTSNTISTLNCSAEVQSVVNITIINPAQDPQNPTWVFNSSHIEIDSQNKTKINFLGYPLPSGTIEVSVQYVPVIAYGLYPVSVEVVTPLSDTHIVVMRPITTIRKISIASPGNNDPWVFNAATAKIFMNSIYLDPSNSLPNLTDLTVLVSYDHNDWCYSISGGWELNYCGYYLYGEVDPGFAGCAANGINGEPSDLYRVFSITDASYRGGQYITYGGGSMPMLIEPLHGLDTEEPQFYDAALRDSDNPLSLEITPVLLVVGRNSTVNTTFSTIANRGIEPLTWNHTSGELPTGVTWSSTTHAITGSPTVAGEFRFSLTVEDSGSQTSKITSLVTMIVL